MASRVLLEDKRVDIDGEIVTYVKGTSESEIKNDIQSRTGGFWSALGSGVENLKGSLGNIPAVGLGDTLGNQALIDRAGRGYEESLQAQRESLPLPTSYKDVLSTYEEEGLFSAIGTAGRFSAESIGQTIPYSLPALFAGSAASSNAGLGIASKLAKAAPFLRTAGAAIPHPVLKMGLGAAAGIGTLTIQFFGDNMQRQYEVAESENEEGGKVTPGQLNSFAAALAAAPQAAMDYVVIALTGGIGRGPQIAAARSLKQSLSATATGKAIPTVGQAARASFAESALEFPTELTQTILERAQAGLSISPQNIDFIEEMIATAAGTLPVAGAFGSYGTVRSYRANKRAQDAWDKGSEDELRIRSSSDDKRKAILEDQFNAAIQMQEENTKAYQEVVDASEKSKEEFDAEVDLEALIADDVIDTALSRNILTDNDAFKKFVYRSTGGRTDVLADASKKELRAMKSILGGFSVQTYFDPATDKGISLPSFTSEEFEAVTGKMKANKKLTPDVVRELLNKKLYPKTRGVEPGSDQERESLAARRAAGEFIVNYSTAPSSIGIADSIIEEMVYRGMATKDAKGNVKSRKTGYTEKQYRTLIDRASTEGSINRSDFEEITRNFKEKAFDAFIGDSIIRGDLPKEQSRNQSEGEYAPLVFWAMTDQEFNPAQTRTGAPKIRGGGVRGRAVTVGNVQTERIDNARGYFVRDEDGTIVGGATSKAEADREAAGLNDLRGRWETTDENGNVSTGPRRRVDLARSRIFGDLQGVGPKKVAGFFKTDTAPSEGFLVRQSITPAVWRKDRETGEIVSEDGPRTGPSRNPPVNITFAPDKKTADAVVNQFAEESSPGFPSAKYDSRREAKAAELRPLWEADKRLFTPPAEADVMQSEGLTSLEEISSKENILKAIPETSRAKGEEVLKVIENKLREANLDKDLTAKVVERIGTSGIGAEGRYSPVLDGFRNIAISMNAIKDAKTNEEIRIAVASIMDHEVIHGMRELDLFTIQEWRVLSGAVARVKNKDGVTFLESASKIYSGMKGYETNQSIVEEAVAEMYRGYYSDPEVRRQISGQPRTLLERIAMFAEKLYNALQGAGFVNAADVISGMKKIQARESGEIRTLKGTEAQAEYENAVLVGAEEDQEQGQEQVSGEPTARRDYGRREYYESGERIDVFEGLDEDRFAFNNPYPYQVTRDNDLIFQAKFVSDKGIDYTFNSDRQVTISGLQLAWYTSFEANNEANNEDSRGGEFGVTGNEREGAMRVLGTIRDIFKNFIQTKKPSDVIFTASKFGGTEQDAREKLTGSRPKIYEREIKKIAKEFNYDIEIDDEVFDVSFALTRRTDPVVDDRLSSVTDGDRFSIGRTDPASFNITEENIPSNIYGSPAREVTIKHASSKGYLRVVVRSDGTVSVVDLYVPEDNRRAGVGKALQRYAQELYPNIGGQVSSKYAAKAAYDLGRRMPSEPNATLEDVYREIDESTSVYLAAPGNESISDSADKLSITDLPAYDKDMPSSGMLPGLVLAFHGGSRSNGAKWDARGDFSGTGEGWMGGGPLGMGVYFNTLKKGGERYLKYGGSNPNLSGVVLDTSNMVNIFEASPKWAPFREAAGRYMSADRAADMSIHDLFRTVDRETAYKILDEAGITGAYEKLPELGHEVVVYDDSIISDLDGDKFSIAPKGHVAYLDMNDPASLDQRPHYSEELRERSRDIARGYIDGDKLSANNERVVNPIDEESNSPIDRAYDELQRTVIGVNDERSYFTKMQDSFSDLSDPVKRSEWSEKWRMKFIDKWSYLEKITKLAALKNGDTRNLLASTNAHSLALLSDRANSVVAASINNGVLVLRGGIARVDYSKKGLRESLAPLFKKDKNIYRTWALWMIANRSARLIKNNTLTNMTVGEIKVVNDRVQREGLLPLFEGVKNDYETWNDYVVDFLKDTGVLNDELAVVFKKYSDYIPFYKDMDLDAEGETGVSPDVFKQILKAENVDLSLGANRRLTTLFPTLTGQKPPSKLKGGSHQIVDPLVGIMQNLRAAVTAGMKNIASVQVLEDASSIGMATELTTEEEIKTAMYTVRVNGEEKYYNASDPLLIETLTGFMDGNVKVWPWLTMPAQWLRESVTRSPMFMIRNIQRDSMSAWVTSGFKATPFISTVDKFQGTLRGMSGDEKTYNTLEGAGVVGGFDYVFEPKKFEKDFRKKLRRSGITPKKDGTFFDSTVGTIWDKLAEVSNKSDSATRQVVYEDTLQNLIGKGVSRVDAESEAIFQAMEVLNFSRRGNSVALRMIAATVPFLNARIQGLDVMFRAMTGQYSSNRKGKLEAQRSFLARGGVIAMATLALSYANNDSEEYKAASDYEKDNFWIIPMPFGMPALKIPIPFEVGLAFKTFPERTSRVLFGDELTADLWDTTLRATFSTLEVPMLGPQAIVPLVEVYANHSLFTGRQVESSFYSGKPSEERFNKYTTELAKKAGELSGFSPIKIQHIIDGYAGTVGSYIVGSTAWLFRQATDAPSVPSWRADQIPIIGSTFQSAESAQGQISEWTEFYYSVHRIGESIKDAGESGDTKRVERLKRENKKILAVMPRLSRINAKVNKLKNKENKIWNSSMDPKAKREQIDKIDRRRKVLLSEIKEFRKLKANSFPLFRGILD